MSVLRKKSKEGWTTIDNSILEDESLSWRAKGLACYLISKPNDWVIRMPHLIHVGKEGEKAVRTALQELAIAGYLMRHREQDTLGQFHTITEIADYPAFIDTGTAEERINGYSKSDTPKTDIPFSDRSETGKSLSTTDIPNTDQSQADDLPSSLPVPPPPAAPTAKARPIPPHTVAPPLPVNGNGASASAGDRDGRMLVALVQSRGFMYLDSQPTKIAMQLESDYTDAQLRTALDKTQEAHQKQIKTGKRGITAPLAYMSQVLAGMDATEAVAVDKNVVQLVAFGKGKPW